MTKKVVYWVILFYHLSVLQCEIFTSIEDLSDVFVLEGKVIRELEQSLNKTSSNSNVKQIERYLRDHEFVLREDGVLNKNFKVENLAGNPIHVFQLLKRLIANWDLVQSFASGINQKDAFWKQSALQEDFEGTVTALIRIQSIYRVNVSELAKGNILGIRSLAVLSAQDCYEIGKKAFVMGLFFSAVEWFRESYVLARTEVDSNVSPSQVIKVLRKSLSSYYDNEETDESGNHDKAESILMDFPGSNTMANSRQYRIGPNVSLEVVFDNYEALCRGENLLMENYKANLKCFFDNRQSPYLTLMPVKVEVHHLDPEILVFHGVVSDAEICHLKTLAKPKLYRGIIQGLPNRDSAASVSRISKVAWMDAYEDDALLMTVERRIEMLTGLRTDLQSGSSELLQVANYGTGGHYNLHYDYLFADDPSFQRKLHPKELELGDRIATFMLYASNVNRGGATVFPKLGVSVWPTKGSAVFWFNLKKSGKGDEMTLHGACPVVHGSKWVANKWIREKNQYMKSCDLIPDK